MGNLFESEEKPARKSRGYVPEPVNFGVVDPNYGKDEFVAGHVDTRI